MSIPQEIPRNNISEKLWCGTLKEISHDLHNHNIQLLIEVNDSNVRKNYSVTLLEVFEFKITYEHPEEAWEYVELTEVEVKQNNHYISFECDLWSSGRMTAKCKDIQIKE